MVKQEQRRLITAAVVSALGHFVPKYQPVMKSRRVNLAECSLSTSHSAMAGTPKGETRNARTRNTIPPTVCPPINRIRESSVSTMQPNSHTADATQNRNVTIAASRDSTTITGAARILRTIIAATSCKIFWVCASMIIVTLKKSGYKDTNQMRDCVSQCIMDRTISQKRVY